MTTVDLGSSHSGDELTPAVSVVIPLHNGAKTLDDAVESVLAQDFHALEVILIDDASQDSSRDMSSRWARRDSRVRIVFQAQNVGLAATLNHGLSLSRGKLVLVMHQDCRLTNPTWLTIAVHLMQEPSIAVVLGTPRHSPRTMESSEKWLWIIRNHLYADGRRSAGMGADHLFSENKCDLFRKEVLSRLGGFDEAVGTGGEDQVLAMELRRTSERVLQPPELEFELTLGSESGVIRGIRRDLEYGRQMRSVLLRTHGKAISRTSGGHWDPRLVNRLSGTIWILVLLASIIVAFALGPLFVLWVGVVAVVLRVFQVSTRAARVRREYYLRAIEITIVGVVALGVDVAYAVGWIVPSAKRTSDTRRANGN
jgi:glycosyltransferase involved in cell wall biosynthesis